MSDFTSVKQFSIKNSSTSRRFVLIVSIIGFAAIGVFALKYSRAASPFIAAEPERGTVSSPATAVTDTLASGGSAVKFSPTTTSACTISDKLVPSCGALLGAWSSRAGINGFRANMEEHEARIKRKLDVVHQYHGPGDVLSADEKFMISRPNTYLFANYKPASTWAAGSGGNATANANIDKMADSIKSVAPNKIILTLHHEPENDVTGGAPDCPASVYSSSASAGTPAEYKAMWANVQSRFAAKGVTNVVWAMTYMGFVEYDCMVDDLWPGDTRVDWLIWEPYFGPNAGSFEIATTKAYNRFMTMSGPGHDFKSKPWGLGEWASWVATTNPPQPDVYALYDSARTSINAGKFPNLKMYVYYDVIGPAHDDRLDFTHSGVADPEEQRQYNLFANSPYMTHYQP